MSFYDWLTSLTQRLPSLSMLSQIAGFLSFLVIFHCMNTPVNLFSQLDVTVVDFVCLVVLSFLSSCLLLCFANFCCGGGTVAETLPLFIGAE